MPIKSIRSRLTAWYVLVLGVTLILFSILLYVFVSKRLYESVDNSLRVSASVVSKAALNKYTNTPFPGLEQFYEQLLGYENINKFYRIYDESGNVGSLSKNIDASQFPMTQKAYANAAKGEETFETIMMDEDHTIRVVTLPVLRNGAMVSLVQVGTSLQNVRETLRNLRIFLFAAVPAVLLVATLVGRFMAGRALQPVVHITQTARDIAMGADLSQRIPESTEDDEIGQLAATFNEMMHRLEKSFSQMRQFSSDASHELRTPLTVLKGQSELTLSKQRTAQDYQETISSNLEEINYMSKILEDLFLLSKSDEGAVVLDVVDVDLGSLVEEVCRHAEILADEKNIDIRFLCPRPVTAKGDVHRLRQMIWNLLDNGIKYTPPGGYVSVAVEENSDSAVLVVEDNGIGIPEEDLPLIFNRFYRVDKSRSRQERGSGLGLSICKFIVESHKGRIDVQSQVDTGTKFTVHLPRSAEHRFAGNVNPVSVAGSA
jgi:heavy metal sensor kinase